MEIYSIQKNIHNSPRKLRLVADLIRGMEIEKALISLNFINKAAAKPLAKAIKTALGNARQMNLDIEKLFFKKLEVNEGAKYKRFRAGSKGRAKQYKKRLSHLKIVLSDEKGGK